jgi:8-oxo-dGTP pyrophosphatase MutT (NUDIX family)
MTNTKSGRPPKKLYAAVPLEALTDALVDGIASCALSTSRKSAIASSGAKRKDVGIVTVRTRDAEREGIAFRATGRGWEPSGRLEPHVLTCKDERALRKVNAHRKTSAGGLLVSSLEDPRVLLMYRVHGDKDAWKTPKGGVAKGETKRRAARREVAEESGIDAVRIVGSLGSMQYFKHEKGRLREKTVHLYLMLSEKGETGIAPREGERFVTAEWLPFDAARERVTQKQARTIITRAERKLKRAAATA